MPSSREPSDKVSGESGPLPWESPEVGFFIAVMGISLAVDTGFGFPWYGTILALVATAPILVVVIGRASKRVRQLVRVLLAQPNDVTAGRPSRPKPETAGLEHSRSDQLDPALVQTVTEPSANMPVHPKRARQRRQPEHHPARPLVERAAFTESSVGRNDPCWCGSGKKFKRCHGA
ncbi:MAG: SEC-C metal-binding domain-containing protein [Solirubrobacteraceae bacterium]